MTRTQENDIREYLRTFELYMPPAYVKQFGEWHKFTNLIEDIISELDDAGRTEDDLYEANSKVENLKEEMENAIANLQDISVDDSVDQKSIDSVADDLQKAIDKYAQ